MTLASRLRMGRKAKSSGGVLPIPGRPTNIMYRIGLLTQPPRMRMLTALPMAVDAAAIRDAIVYSME